MLNEFMLRGDAPLNMNSFNIDVEHHILASPLNMNSFNIDVKHHLLTSMLRGDAKM
jgi:hypothetical protein